MADYTLILFIILSAYFIRGITGFGSGLIAVPLLALSNPLQFAVPLVLALDFTASFILGGASKKQADWSEIKALLPFGLVGVSMQAMFHNAAFLAVGVPVFDIREKFGATGMPGGSGTKGIALAEAMGDKDVVLMRAHGSVACGATLQTAVFRAVYTEVNARIQHGHLHARAPRHIMRRREL